MQTYATAKSLQTNFQPNFNYGLTQLGSPPDALLFDISSSPRNIHDLLLQKYTETTVKSLFLGLNTTPEKNYIQSGTNNKERIIPVDL